MILDRNKKMELDEIRMMAGRRLDDYKRVMDEQFPDRVPKLSRELWDCIEEVRERFGQLEKEGKAGRLEWIYVSFLRTGLMDRSACYRIDLYDSRDRISDLECAGSWGFEYVYDKYYKIMDEIKQRIQGQMRIKLYEAEDVVEFVTNEFHRSSDKAIKQLIEYEKRKGHRGWMAENGIKIVLGDFLGETKEIISFSEG